MDNSYLKSVTTAIGEEQMLMKVLKKSEVNKFIESNKGRLPINLTM